jgi:undecaprenyl-diphosphatase
MSIWEAIVLGIVEGLTEFLPVSSTGHLTITSKIFGQQIDDPSITAFTAVIQAGAIAAVILFFWSDIRRIAIAWFRGLANPEHRGRVRPPDGLVPDRRLAADLFRRLRLPRPDLRRAAQPVVGGGVADRWSFVMVAAERLGSKKRPLEKITFVDSLVMGLLQCLALIPGVSRSGATISAGLFRGWTGWPRPGWRSCSAFPALIGAAVFELQHALRVRSVSSRSRRHRRQLRRRLRVVAWLLKFVQKHTIELSRSTGSCSAWSSSSC